MTFDLFGLRGPQFLMFYLATSVVVYWVVRLFIQSKENEYEVPKLDLSDAYSIAILRAGNLEALRVATVSLLDRGLLIADGTTLRTKNDQSLSYARRPIEKAILKKYLQAGESKDLFADKELLAICSRLRQPLEELHLVVGPRASVRRASVVGPAIVMLAGLALYKVRIALSGGHKNIELLLTLMFLNVIFLGTLYLKTQTALGARVLVDVQNLLSGLRMRGPSRESAGSTNEAALLVAAFGITALNGETYSVVKQIFPANSSGNSCGSSCGSGGCGGGGGCGGCGS